MLGLDHGLAADLYAGERNKSTSPGVTRVGRGPGVHVDQIATQSVIACIVNRRARSDTAAQLSERVAELFRAHGVKAETEPSAP